MIFFLILNTFSCTKCPQLYSKLSKIKQNNLIIIKKNIQIVPDLIDS